MAALLRAPATGPAMALLVAVAVFGLTADAFLDLDNLSLVVRQSLVVGTLALGQTLVITAAGVDLSNAATAVFATLLIAELTVTGTPGPLALAIGVLAAGTIGCVAGGLVTALRMPPLITTLALLVILTALNRADAPGYPVTDGTLRWLGTTKYLFGHVEVTYGMALMAAMYAGVWYALTRTVWGTHLRAAGSAPEAARLSGVPVRRTVVSAYVVAGVIYGVAAWQALGRAPTADPTAFPLANLDSITAAILGGATLRGGRCSVAGTLMGALLVTVLRVGLTQTGVDDLYQDMATGVLLLVAVALDSTSRSRP